MADPDPRESHAEREEDAKRLPPPEPASIKTTERSFSLGHPGVVRAWRSALLRPPKSTHTDIKHTPVTDWLPSDRYKYRRIGPRWGRMTSAELSDESNVQIAVSLHEEVKGMSAVSFSD